MIIHNFNPVLIDLGLFQIRWYSMAYILGIILGWIYAKKIIKKTAKKKYNFASIKTSQFDDIIVYLSFFLTFRLFFFVPQIPLLKQNLIYLQ